VYLHVYLLTVTSPIPSLHGNALAALEQLELG
jgi:hypothetical protein